MMVLALLFPALMASACVSARFRAIAHRALWLAPLPALGAALFAQETTFSIGTVGRLQMVLLLDSPRALLLGAVALLWSFAGAFAATSLRLDAHAARFSFAWLLSLTGCVGVFMAGDLVSFYLLFALVSLAASVLVVHDGTPKAMRAARVYLALAVLGEAFLLLAFVRLATGVSSGSAFIHDAVAALADSPQRNGTLLLLLLGFGVKAGLVPLHGWLPLAHPAAPTPASAVLSGAIIKTGIIGLIVFLPLGTALSEWGTAITAIGFVTAFTGVLLGITQSNPKTILAYSSVSQMGVTVAVIGAGLGAGALSAGEAAAFYAMHHVFVKGALFLSVGVMNSFAARARWMVLVPSCVLALSFAGMPLTGGSIAKLATKEFFTSDLNTWLAVFAGSGSALLMLHFMRHLAKSPLQATPARFEAGLVVPWLLTVVTALIAPWLLYGSVLGGESSAALTPAALWSALWPVLIGAAAALIVSGSGRHLPAVPEGDLIIFAERGTAVAWARTAILEQVEHAARRWSVAGMALLAIIVLLTLLLR